MGDRTRCIQCFILIQEDWKVYPFADIITKAALSSQFFKDPDRRSDQGLNPWTLTRQTGILPTELIRQQSNNPLQLIMLHLNLPWSTGHLTRLQFSGFPLLSLSGAATGCHTPPLSNVILVMRCLLPTAPSVSCVAMYTPLVPCTLWRSTNVSSM